MLKARDVMSTDVFTVHKGKDLNFVEVMAELRHVRHVPVLEENGKPIGMLSIRDMLQHLSKAGASHFIPVGELMTPLIGSVTPDTPVQECARLMIEHVIGSVVVVENDALIGIVTERDFVAIIAKQ